MAQDLSRKIIDTTRELLDVNGLHGWTVALGQAVRTAGTCNYTKREIRISLRLAKVEPWEQTLDTIRHEVAHAIAGHRAGHGPEWKRVARNLGMRRPRASRRLQGEIDLPWTGTCPNGHTTQMVGAPRKPRTCGVCSPVFDLDYLFEWTKDGKPVAMSKTYREALEEAELMRKFERVLQDA